MVADSVVWGDRGDVVVTFPGTLTMQQAWAVENRITTPDNDEEQARSAMAALLNDGTSRDPLLVALAKAYLGKPPTATGGSAAATKKDKK
jgi:hypothetical protein